MDFNSDLEETYTLLGVFSAEIWNMILDNLDAALDYQNISTSTTLFHQLLQPKRTAVLFGDVLKVMVHFRGSELSHTLPLIRDLSTILTMRLVSREWMKGVDRILQTTDPQKSTQDILMLRWFGYNCRRSPRFITEDSILEFQKHFRDTHYCTGRNPFLTRSIVIHLSANIFHPTNFCDRLVEFLRTYGVHVWNCFVMLEEFEDAIEFYRFLPTILDQMPNLKMFLFDSDNFGRLTNNQVARTKHSVTQLPWPVLKNLGFIHNQGIPLTIFEALLKSAPHLDNIETLGVEKAKFDSKKLQKHIKICLEQAPNLTTFATNISTLRDWMEFKAAIVTCRLVKLEIDFQLSVSWNSIFRKLEEHFGSSVEVLTLCLPESRRCDKGLTLELPKLKTVNLVLQINEPLDFLLPMRGHLESLAVANDNLPYNADHAEMSVKLKEFYETYDEVKVKTMFPKLKNFTLKPYNTMIVKLLKFNF